MRTTLDLPEDLLQEAMQATHIKTKTKVITVASEELVRKSKISAFLSKIRTWNIILATRFCAVGKFMIILGILKPLTLTAFIQKNFPTFTTRPKNSGDI